MVYRLLPFFLSLVISAIAYSQQSPTGAAPNFVGASSLAPTRSKPSLRSVSPEEFVNAIYPTVVDSTFPHYYLVMGTDSCRFLKYDYDEWIKYHLKEPLTLNILNELSEKVYLSRYPYFWKQPQLQKALLITRKQADSILGSHAPLPADAPSKVKRKWRQNLEHLPAWQ